MWDDRFEAVVRGFTPTLSPGSPLDPGDDLRALGMDSVATAALVVELEAQYGVTLEMADLVPENFRTPQRIWELVQARNGVRS